MRICKHGLAGHLLGAHVGRSGNRAEHPFDFVGLAHQHVEVVAVQNRRHVGADAGDHFVHPHLNRLRHREPRPWQVAQFLLNQDGQFVLRVGPLPLFARLQA